MNIELLQTPRFHRVRSKPNWPAPALSASDRPGPACRAMASGSDKRLHTASSSLRWHVSLATLALALLSFSAQGAWRPADGPLMTRWAKEVSPERAHPEYPRPQLV